MAAPIRTGRRATSVRGSAAPSSRRSFPSRASRFFGKTGVGPNRAFGASFIREARSTQPTTWARSVPSRIWPSTLRAAERHDPTASQLRGLRDQLQPDRAQSVEPCRSSTSVSRQRRSLQQRRTRGWAYWTNHPECVIDTYVETIENPPVPEIQAWRHIVFDVSSLLGDRANEDRVRRRPASRWMACLTGQSARPR